MTNQTQKQAAPDWLSDVGGAINTFLQKPENRWVLPSLVGGGLLGAGSTLFNRRAGMGSVLGRGLLGSLLGAGLGWGLPRLLGGRRAAGQFGDRTPETEEWRGSYPEGATPPNFGQPKPKWKWDYPEEASEPVFRGEK